MSRAMNSPVTREATNRIKAVIKLHIIWGALAITGTAQCFDSLKAQDQPAPSQTMAFGARPGVRFLTPNSAEIRWETTIAGPAVVAYGPTRKLGQVITSEATGTSHRVVLTELAPGQNYYYRFGLNRDGKRSFSEIYQFEGAMNYSPPVIDDVIPLSAAEKVIGQLVQRGGYALVDSAERMHWSESIAAGTEMTVVTAVDDVQSLNRLRRHWYDTGRYGIRMSVQLKSELPDSFANLVIADADQIAAAAKRMSPSGQLISIGDPLPLPGFHWDVIEDGVSIARRETPVVLAAWGHQYGTSGNASYSGEMLGGVDDTADLVVKWIGRPGADFGIDRNPRMPAPLAVGGRLFHQGMNRMIALDAFNGAVLWSLEIPDLRRVNIPRDAANWCADEDHVYAAVKDRLWVIDASSGEMLRTLLLPESSALDSEWGYVAVTDKLVIGTAMKRDSGYSGFWDKAAWYDGKDDAATAKVCGNAIVGYDKQYGSIEWQRDADAIVHSTITIQGNHLYFVEVDDPSLRGLESGKLNHHQIWKSASIVCLNLETGQQLWKSAAPSQDHETIVSFGFADDNQFVLQTSGKNQFHFASFDADTGDRSWGRSVDWPEDHHGAHVQHAVLMNGQIFVQPHILNAADGSVIKSGTLGKRRGCATPIGAGRSIIYRGGTGPLTLWSIDKDTPSEFARLRPSCWLSTIPAQGMLFSPEGGGGCSCGGWMETSIGFAPLIRSEATP